jgi:Tol biopolymer transport system component
MTRLLRVVSAALLAAIVIAAPELRDLPARASVPRSGPVAGVPGRWLYVTYTADGRSLLRTIEPSTKRLKDLVVFPVGSYAGGPAAAPDGRRVAYSVFRTGAPGGDPGGADLFVMDADGSHARMVLAHDRPGVSLGQPAWTPDGRALLFVRASPDGRVRIDRVPAAGGASQVVVTDADSPTAASPGRLAFLRIDPISNAPSLWIAAADGRFARPLVNQPAFLAMASPRFSPDGRRIAFSAARDPGQAPPRRSEHRRRGSVAWAHGLPMDIWVVNVDGSGLRQLTELGEDDPVPAWSTDARWVAFSGAFGLYLLEPASRDVRLVHDDVSSGLTWLLR